jgi:arabinonate dehydratase
MSALAGRRPTDAVHLHPDDNLCVASRNLEKGQRLAIAGTSITLTENVRLGHKIAVRPIRRDEYLRKYGQIIGQATSDISPGQWIHSHNLVNGEFARDYASATAIPPPPAPIAGRTFLGYRRPSGPAGTRNYIAVVSTVNCSATVCKHIAQHFTPERLRDFPGVDGVIAVKHGGGCGIQYQGLQHEVLNRTLAGMARHPNIGGYLMQSKNLVQIEVAGTLRLPTANGTRSVPTTARPPVLSMQELGGTAKTVAAGIKLVEQLLPQVNAASRQPIPASEIILGTNCGGSDGNSGVTCNPALGVASDMIVACGGTAALAETTEI